MSTCLRSIAPGRKVRLKPGVMRRMTTREWIFKELRNDNIAWLMHESGFYGIGVHIEFIDWQDYRERESS